MGPEDFKLKAPRGHLLESELQRQVIDWLNIHRVLVVRVPVGPVLHRKGFGANVKQHWKKNPLKGFPDLHGVLRRRHKGRAFYLELKSKTGSLEQEQRMWLTDLAAAGAAVAVVRSLEDLVRIMAEWGEVGGQDPSSQTGGLG